MDSNQNYRDTSETSKWPAALNSSSNAMNQLVQQKLKTTYMQVNVITTKVQEHEYDHNMSLSVWSVKPTEILK